MRDGVSFTGPVPQAADDLDCRQPPRTTVQQDGTGLDGLRASLCCLLGTLTMVATLIEISP